ncbi:MAG: septum site-determining protein MinC [Clostridia bacterium]
MSQELVVFKGSKNGITVILDTGLSIAEIIERMKQKLVDSSSFFAGAKLNISFTGRILDESEQQQITEVLKETIGNDMHITYNVIDSDNRQGFYDFCEISEGLAKFHRGTIRSGQRLTAEESLVIFGDINPGAEIAAGGNVIVMGSLRGIVHAGCFGNRYSIVAALNLHPTQLRIADIITRSPDDEENKHGFVPEIAYVKDDMIYIDAYLPKKSVEK